MFQHFKFIYFILLIGLISIPSCKPPVEDEVELIRPVYSYTVGYKQSHIHRTYSGTAQTDKVINLSFRGQGILTRFNVDLGQKVRKGQLLGTLDNVSAKLAYEQSLASLSSADSQVKTAKLNFDRIRSLYEKGSASLSDFENAKNAFKTAENSLEASERSVDLQKEQMRYGYLYAPATGVISQVMAEINEFISPGKTVAVLNVQGQMSIDVGLPENMINMVQIDNEVDITFAVLNDQTFKGKIVEISPSEDPATSTYPIRIKIIKPSSEIKSGMAATITFHLDELAESKLVIPANSVGEDIDGHFVYLIVPSNDGTATVKKSKVKIGKLTPDGFEIKEGLTEGQQIVTAGLQSLINGQQIKI